MWRNGFISLQKALESIDQVKERFQLSTLKIYLAQQYFGTQLIVHISKLRP